MFSQDKQRIKASSCAIIPVLGYVPNAILNVDVIYNPGVKIPLLEQLRFSHASKSPEDPRVALSPQIQNDVNHIDQV